MPEPRTCRHCGHPIHWDTYWETWDHTGRQRAMTAELCAPDLGFGGSTHAEPATT